MPTSSIGLDVSIEHRLVADRQEDTKRQIQGHIKYHASIASYGFESRPFCFQVTTLGKLFAQMCLYHQAVQFGTSQWTVMPALGLGGVMTGLEEEGG